MAQPSHKSTYQPRSALLVRGRMFFRNVSIQGVPRDLQRLTVVSDRHQRCTDDIGVLAMTYILQDNPTIQELIRLVINFNDRDNGKVCTSYNL